MLGKTKLRKTVPEKIKKLSLLFLVVFLFSISLYSLVLAQDLEVDYPNIMGEAPQTVQDGLPVYAIYIFNFAIAISGLLAMGSFIYGGILYMMSGLNPSKLKDAKSRMLSGSLGMLLLVGSVLLLNTINPDLLIFDFEPLTPIDPGEYSTYTTPYREVLTLVVARLPVKAAMTTATVWEEERTEELEELIIEFETFLNEEINMTDSNLENDDFDRISNLNKYLKTVSDDCRCENTRALCTKPQSGSMPIGCEGDPCEEETREKITNILAIDRTKIDILNEFEEKISKHEDILREEIRRFQRIEGEIISCRTQNQEFMTLNDLLLIKQHYEEQGNQVLEITGYDEDLGVTGYDEPGDDALTFYCPVGGTIYDAPYVPQKIEELYEEPIETSSPYEAQLISCHTKIPTGETIDELRELAVVMAFKLEELSRLTKLMAQQVQEMTELVSQCNRTFCRANCSCIPNPWYNCCSPIPCGPFVAVCRSRCLQAIGGCNGDACPVEEITQKSEDIKETEDKILGTTGTNGIINEIKTMFPDVIYHAQNPENPINLHNLDTATRLCFDPNIDDPKAILLSCEGAKGNYGPNGSIMTNCNPRDLYCCTPRNDPPLPVSSDSDPMYIVPLKEYSILGSVNGCPQGYDCSSGVRNHNQYDNDASKPLKQLISCMRQGLDTVQQAQETEEIIGLISSISDEKLYTGTCDWDVSPEDSGGCSHAYEIGSGKRKVSAHYGGTFCRDTEESYAVDFDMSSEFQKKYIAQIIEQAKKCAPDVYILDKTTHLHIDIGEIYDCETSDF